MESRVTLRPPLGLALTVALWLVCLTCLVALCATGDTHDVLAYGPWLVATSYLTWMLFWAPAVIVEDRGVRLRNVARTRVVAWSTILSIETKYNLTLVTSAGSFGAWAAPAPGIVTSVRGQQQPLAHLPESTYGPGRSIAIGDLPRSESGVAAYHVRRGLELRDGGKLPADDGLVTTHWHRTELVGFGAVLFLSVLATVLTR
jgi:hypothetical protein